MERIERTKTPPWLKPIYRDLGIKWRKRLHLNKKAVFFWNAGAKYEELKARLLEMTQHHCAYCDAYPLQRRIYATIDHFRPKRKYPNLAYCWLNLFPCCHHCQERNDFYDKKLLKPDKASYYFHLYFKIEWETGVIIPIEADKHDLEALARRECAQLTIKAFNWNKSGRPDDRLMELERFEALPPERQEAEWNDFCYRFMLRRGTDWIIPPEAAAE